MKIAIITDSHFGVRNDSIEFFDYFMRFFDEVFFPTLKDRNIDTVIHMGDFFDRRKYGSYRTIKAIRERFVNKLTENGIATHLLVGNHDTYLKNSSKINSPDILLNGIPGFKIYENPTEVVFDDLPVLFLPWINRENYDASIKAINDTKAPIAFGHLEIKGFQVMRGVASPDGLPETIFRKFEDVYSGHFHQKHSKANIHYLGTMYDLTFSDLYEQKGFHIFDTESRDIEYIKNPEKMFYPIMYDDVNEDYTNPILAPYKDKYVKVFVQKRNNLRQFDRYIESLYNSGVSSLIVVEDLDEDTAETEVDLIDLGKGTVELINEEIDTIENLDSPNTLKTIMKDLFTEAMNL